MLPSLTGTGSALMKLLALFGEREGRVLMFTRVGVMAPGFVSAFGMKLKWFVGGGNR